MGVISRLQSIGVALCSDALQIPCGIFEPIGRCSAASPTLFTQEDPLVSCLMITRGNTDLMRYSLACYQQQTYPHRELVVVAEPDVKEKVRAFVSSQPVFNANIIVPPPGLTIGDHRNLAVTHARGSILVTWDDDDLFDPRRLHTSVQALRQTGAAAVFIGRLLLWWPQRRLAAISERRAWEQSIAAWRSVMPVYACLPRGEDTMPINALVNNNRTARVDCPFLYIYAVTGQNTWGTSHFEKILSRAQCVFEGDEFDELGALLSKRLPVLEYAEMLTGKKWHPQSAHMT